MLRRVACRGARSPLFSTRLHVRQLAYAQTVVRDPRFSSLLASDVDYFRQVLGPSGVLSADSGDEVALTALNRDWMGNWSGSSRLALRPKTTQEVSAVLAHCNARRLAVVPQSGNTGLVGGSVPLFDEVIVSMTRMDSILALDPHSGVVVAEAGVVLEKLNSFLEDKGHIMPLDLGAKGSCLIGGNAATNAGGIRFLRYGSLRGSILGMESVLADGTVIDTLTTLRKDNTGYDLKQLMIGSEGTLGLITKLAILAPRKPRSVHVAFLGLPSYAAVLEILSRARSELGEILSAIEFLDRGSLELVTKHLPGTRDPLNAAHPLYVLIETSGSNAEHDSDKLTRFLELVMGEQGGSALAHDGTLAQDVTQIKALWRLREGVAEALMRAGSVYKYDISLPVDRMYEFVEDMRNRLQDRAKVVGYGHLGDGNLHLNVSVPTHTSAVQALIEPYLFERVASVRGSVSAEHGVGQCKVGYLHLSKPPAAIALMKTVKAALDPNGILNPYKVLPAHA